MLAILDPEMLRSRWLAVSATALTAYFRPVLGWLRAYGTRPEPGTPCRCRTGDAPQRGRGE